MSHARYIIGDVRDVLASMPDASVDLVLTSPPFLALRSYLPADHPDKAKEIGSEPTPGEFIDTLLDLTEEFRRVLAPHGSIAIELGDTYSGSGGAGGDYSDDGLRAGQNAFDGSNRRRRQSARAWPDDKSLCLIPELYRISLVYGFNPLTGRTTPRWRARNVVRWCRPNPPVGALGDKFRPATSDMVVACMDRKRYFDLDAVRMPVREEEWAKAGQASGESYQGTAAAGDGYSHGRVRQPNPAGAPPLDWWNIPTEPYAGSHYATWPTALLTRPILAMCPQKVCTVCGKPSERIAETTNAVSATAPRHDEKHRRANADDSNVWRAVVGATASERTTLGWTDCGHNAWRNGIVLDPFGGSGTTGQVATGHGRDAILIDLDERNADLATQRIGMFVTVEQHTPTEDVA